MGTVRNWKKSKTYCRHCRQWHTPVAHRDCPQGSQGSVVWLDLEQMEMGCDKCHHIWPLEDNTFYCSCGHVQKTEYRDSVLHLESGDQVLATDGEFVYVLTRSGTVVVGQRDYLDHSYVA